MINASADIDTKSPILAAMGVAMLSGFALYFIMEKFKIIICEIKYKLIS